MSRQECDWQMGKGSCSACRRPFFLSVAWPFVALKPRIKGYRKLPGLILDKHVDGLGRPHQQLHLSGMAAVTVQALQGFWNAYVWVMVRAVTLGDMRTSGPGNNRFEVTCTGHGGGLCKTQLFVTVKGVTIDNHWHKTQLDSCCFSLIHCRLKCCSVKWHCRRNFHV